MTNARSVKEAECLAERAAARARSHNRLRETLDGYYPLESSPHMRASGLNMPSNTSSDMFSPLIPATPPPEYSCPPQYSPSRRSREVPEELSPERRRASTRSASREMSPPPKYHKEDVAYCDDIYYGGKARSTSRILPRSKPIRTFDVNSIYSLAGSHVVDMTPPKLGRLALAASRESRSSKKEFESHKRHTHNYAPPLTEELGISHEVDDIASNILEDIAAIGGSGRQTARAAFHHAFSR